MTHYNHRENIMKTKYNLSIVFVLIVGLLALVQPIGATQATMDGNNWTNIDSIKNQAGNSFILNSTFLCGANTTCTYHANGSVSISSTGGSVSGMSNPATADLEMPGYSVLNVTNYTTSQGRHLENGGCDTSYCIRYNLINSSIIEAINGSTGITDYSGTNASTVINSAITSASGEVHITSGAYNLATILNGKSNLIISGDGDSTILRNSSGYKILLQFSNTNNITIKDLVIDANHAGIVDETTYTLPALHLNNVNNFYIDKVSIIGSGKQAIYIQNSTNGTITDISVKSYILETLRDGMAFYNDTNINIDNFFGATGDDSLVFNAVRYFNVNNVIITGNDLNPGIKLRASLDNTETSFLNFNNIQILNKNWGFHTWVSTDSGTIHDININNFIANSISGDVILFKNDNITNNPYAIYNIKISGLIANNTGSNVIQVDNMSSKNIEIHDSTMKNSGSNAILTNGVDNFSVYNTEISGSIGYNINLNGNDTNILINGVTSTGATLDGLYAINTGFYSNPKQPKLNNLKIINSVFSGNSRDGLRIGYNATLINSVVENNGGAAITTITGVNGLIVRNNMLSGTFTVPTNLVSSSIYNNYGQPGTQWGSRVTSPNVNGFGDEYTNSTSGLKYLANLTSIFNPYMTLNKFIAGSGVSLTQNATSGELTINANVSGMSNPATADLNMSGYNVTGATNITSKQIGGVIYADQYATIQDAINASISGQEIYIPSGVYLSNSLTAKSNIKIRGAGRNSTVIKPSGAITSMLIIDGVSDFSVEDLTFNGNNLAQSIVTTNTTAIPYTINNDIRFEHITFNNSISTMLNIFGHGYRWKFNDVSITEAGLDALHMQYDIDDVIISNSIISDNYRDGIAFGDLDPAGSPSIIGIPVTNAKIYGNTIENNAIGVNVEDGNYAINVQNLSIKIYGNTIRNNTKSAAYGGGSGSPGINVNINSSGVNIFDNDIYGNFAGITIGTSGNTPGNIISNNYIYSNNAVPSDTISQSGIIIESGNYTKVENNKIFGHSKYGISLFTGGLIGFSIIDNEIYENNLHGLYAYRIAGYGRIDSNEFRNNGLLTTNTYSDLYINDDAVSPYLKNTSIRNNKFYAQSGNKTAYGINIANSQAKNNKISDNEFIGQTTQYTIIPSGNIIKDNYNVAPFSFGNSATAPTAFGAGDPFYNTTANIQQLYTGSIWDWLLMPSKVYGSANVTVTNNNNGSITISSVGASGCTDCPNATVAANLANWNATYNLSYAKGGFGFSIENGTNVIETGYSNNLTTIYAGTLVKLIAHSAETGSINVSLYNGTTYIDSVVISAGTDGSKTLSYAFGDETLLRYNVSSVTDIKKVSITGKTIKS